MGNGLIRAILRIICIMQYFGVRHRFNLDCPLVFWFAKFPYTFVCLSGNLHCFIISRFSLGDGQQLWSLLTMLECGI